MSLVTLDAFLQDHDTELADLVDRFADYDPTAGVDKAHLRKWLAVFSPQDLPLAIQLAKYIRYYGTDKINGLMRKMHRLIEQQKRAEDAQHKEVFYVPFGRCGQSGHHILRSYRNINKLKSWGDQFVSTVELPSRIVNAKRPVVFFLDDFVGTGEQVSNEWRETIGQIVPDHLPLYLVVIAALREGMRHVEKNTPLSVLCVHVIGPNLQLKDSGCKAFSPSDKSAIEEYCTKAGNMPLGYRDVGLLLSFAYGTPNNTISIIRGSKRQRPIPGLLPDWEDMG